MPAAKIKLVTNDPHHPSKTSRSLVSSSFHSSPPTFFSSLSPSPSPPLILPLLLFLLLLLLVTFNFNDNYRRRHIDCQRDIIRIQCGVVQCTELREKTAHSLCEVILRGVANVLVGENLEN